MFGFNKLKTKVSDIERSNRILRERVDHLEWLNRNPRLFDVGDEIGVYLVLRYQSECNDEYKITIFSSSSNFSWDYEVFDSIEKKTKWMSQFNLANYKSNIENERTKKPTKL